MAATLFQALAQRMTIVDIVYKRNALQLDSVIALEKILQYKPPNNLLELRLVNCQSSTKAMKTLLKALVTQVNNEDSYLRTLALVKMKINFPLDSVAQLLKSTAL